MSASHSGLLTALEAQAACAGRPHRFELVRLGWSHDRARLRRHGLEWLTRGVLWWRCARCRTELAR